jgi:hypothetical protein
VFQTVCSALKVIERTLVNPWVFWPVVINIALFGTSALKISQRADTAGLYFALFLAWYTLIFFYFLNISFFDLFVSPTDTIALDRRFEDVKYSSFSHFTISGTSSRLFFQLTPEIVHTWILYTVAILAGALPLVAGTLAPISSRIFGVQAKITQLFVFCASAPDLFFYGFFFLCLLVFLIIMVIATIASEPGVLITGFVLLGLGILIILYPQIFWRYNPATRPPMMLSALLPPLGVIYTALQTISFRAATGKTLYSQKEYKIGLVWVALLAAFVIANIVFPLD